MNNSVFHYFNLPKDIYRTLNNKCIVKKITESDYLKRISTTISSPACLLSIFMSFARA